MKQSLRLYRWSMHLKYRMTFYFALLIALKAVTVYSTGGSSISIGTMLEVFFASLLISVIEHFCFPDDREFSKEQLCTRTLIWFGGLNLVLIGGCLLFGWLTGVPGWMVWVIAVAMELVLVFLWFGFHVAEKMDTKALNQGLEKFQR